MGHSNKDRPIFLDKRLLQSVAFRSLNTINAHLVLVEFWIKRRMQSTGRKGKKQWIIANNGEIEFLYTEACEKFGITSGTFKAAIDELRDKGFIDIAASGQGTHKVKNLYSISSRWKLYGTKDYKPPKERKKGPINRGFQKGNNLGRNCKKKV